MERGRFWTLFLLLLWFSFFSPKKKKNSKTKKFYKNHLSRIFFSLLPLPLRRTRTCCLPAKGLAIARWCEKCLLNTYHVRGVRWEIKSGGRWDGRNRMKCACIATARGNWNARKRVLVIIVQARFSPKITLDVSIENRSLSVYVNV
jgi:hypothetical protein